MGLVTAFAVMALASSALASNVGFSFGINVGNIPAPVYAPPVYAPPAYAPPAVVIDEPPEFVAPPTMGFYAAVGTPYDLFYAANRYYLCRGNAWYSAPYYNGPWVQVGYGALPWGLRRYPIARMRYMRDTAGYDDYYGYRHFRPERNDWRGGHRGWEGERVYQVRHHHHARYWADDDD